MIRSLLVASLAIASFAVGPVLGQEALCFQNEVALVIVQERTEEAGMNVLARAPAKGKIKCEYAEHEGDWIIGQPDDPLWYEGMAGKYLVLSRSTGPDGNIVIYNLTDRSAVIDEPADSEISITDNEVTFWQRTIKGTVENCPQFEEYSANWLGAIIAEEKVLDAASGEIKPTGQTRCSATQ